MDMTESFFKELMTKPPKHRRTHEDSAVNVFAWRGTEIGESLANMNSWVALDTNVLLLPYRAGPSSFHEILGVYRSLSQNNRLVVPGQAAREFAKNRPAVLGNAVKNIDDLPSKVASLPPLPPYPLLGELPAFIQAKEALARASTAVQDYKRALKELHIEVSKLAYSDPVSEGYQTIFDESVVVDPDISEEILDASLKFRMENTIPPGLKDSAKSDGGFGDVLIWLTLLQLAEGSARDLVFVTQERKSDWWHRTNSNPLLPRYELIDEYRRVSKGGTLHLVSLSDLLEHLKISESVVTEIRTLEAVVDSSDGARYVRDGATVLIRGEAGYGAIQPIRQTIPPTADEAVEFSCWYSDNLDDYLRNRITPTYGRCDAVMGTITVGPYEIPWSGSGDGSGWFYYREYLGTSSTAADYELAVVDSEPVDWSYFRNGQFFRGQVLD